jgi:hypothetical protein
MAYLKILAQHSDFAGQSDMAEGFVPCSAAIAVGHAFEAGPLDHKEFYQER